MAGKDEVQTEGITRPQTPDGYLRVLLYQVRTGHFCELKNYDLDLRIFSGNGWEFGDLNTAMMAAIMAEQIARSKRLEEAEQLKRLQRLEELEKLKQQTIDAQQRSKV